MSAVASLVKVTPGNGLSSNLKGGASVSAAVRSHYGKEPDGAPETSFVSRFPINTRQQVAAPFQRALSNLVASSDVESFAESAITWTSKYWERTEDSSNTFTGSLRPAALRSLLVEIGNVKDTLDQSRTLDPAVLNIKRIGSKVSDIIAGMEPGTGAADVEKLSLALVVPQEPKSGEAGSHFQGANSSVSEYQPETIASVLEKLRHLLESLQMSEGDDAGLSLQSAETGVSEIQLETIASGLEKLRHALTMLQPPEGDEMGLDFKRVESGDHTFLPRGEFTPEDLFRNARGLSIEATQRSSGGASQKILESRDSNVGANAISKIDVSSKETSSQPKLRLDITKIEQPPLAQSRIVERELASGHTGSQSGKQISVAELVLRADSATLAESTARRAVARASIGKTGNSTGKGDLDPRAAAANAATGVLSHANTKAMNGSGFQVESVLAGQTGVEIANIGTAKFFDMQVIPEAEPNGIVSGFSSGEDQTSRSTFSKAPNSRPTGFSLALAEQLRAVKVHDGVTKVQLSPRGLGIIEVEVVTDIDDTTNIVIRSDNAVVLNALKDVRELVSQVINLDAGGTLDFEESSSDGGSRSEEELQDRGAELGTSRFQQIASDGADKVAVINGNQLDIMA